MLYSHSSGEWKIADFGFTSAGSSNNVFVSQFSRGTSSYRAPELIREGRYTTKVDIWALGCIVYEIVTQLKAFHDDWQVLRYADARIPLNLPAIKDHIGPSSEFFRSLTDKTLNWEWAQRPSAQDLFHGEFRNFNTSLLQSSADAARIHSPNDLTLAISHRSETISGYHGTAESNDGNDLENDQSLVTRSLIGLPHRSSVASPPTRWRTLVEHFQPIFLNPLTSKVGRI